MTTDLSTSQLEYHRRTILDHLEIIETHLKNNHPKEHEIAYSHWIPQIITALCNDTKWLPRGEHSLQDSIDRINDSYVGSGVKKFI
jgi:soluble cytochrome b562